MCACVYTGIHVRCSQATRPPGLPGAHAYCHTHSPSSWRSPCCGSGIHQYRALTWLIGGFPFSVTKSESTMNPLLHTYPSLFPPRFQDLPICTQPQESVSLLGTPGRTLMSVYLPPFVHGGCGSLEASGNHFLWCSLALLYENPPVHRAQHPHHFSLQYVP